MADVDEEWRKYAYCSGNANTVRVMFAHKCVHACNRSGGRECAKDVRVIQAKQMCASCPVLDHCRWWAITTNLLHGVAGGMTYAERLKVRKALKKDKTGLELLKGDIEISWS